MTPKIRQNSQWILFSRRVNTLIRDEAGLTDFLYEWESDIEIDFLNLKRKPGYLKRRLQDYKQRMWVSFQEHQKNNPRISWEPQRLRDFMRRGAPHKQDDYYRKISEWRRKGLSQTELIQKIRQQFPKQDNPSQDIKRALERFPIT
jgi:hypothetical protein